MPRITDDESSGPSSDEGSTRKWRRPLLGVLVAVAVVMVAVVAVVVVDQTRGVSTPLRPTPTDPGGLRLEGATVFNVPVSDLQVDPRSDDWTRRLWEHATTDAPGTWITMSGLPGKNNRFNDYASPLYDARTANVRRRVRQKTNFPGAMGVAPDETVAWNDSWLPSDGTDGFLVTYDPTTGQEWDYWNVSFPGYQQQNDHSLGCINSQNLPPPFGVGFDINEDICAATAVRVTAPDGTPADLRTYTGNFPPAGGGGIQNTVGAVTPQEVAAGAVRHAWKMNIWNTMFGPECAPAERTDPKAFGVTCGGAVAPAGQFEKSAYSDGTFVSPVPPIRGATPTEQRSNTVPEGMRFSLRLTDAEIESWLDSRGYQGTLRTTARTLAVSLRDYGWFVTDTTGGPAGFGLLGSRNPETEKGWRALGLVGSSQDLLIGLFTRDRLVTWSPPVNTCADGTKSTWQCWASSIAYPE